MKSTITAISLRPFSYQLVSMLAFFSLIGFGFNSRLVAQEKEVITGISNVLARYKSIRMSPIRLYLRPSKATEIGLLKQRQKSKVFEDNISTELMRIWDIRQKICINIESPRLNILAGFYRPFLKRIFRRNLFGIT